MLHPQLCALKQGLSFAAWRVARLMNIPCYAAICLSINKSEDGNRSEFGHMERT